MRGNLARALEASSNLTMAGVGSSSSEDSFSLSEDSCDDSDVVNFLLDVRVGGIKPYQFEPRVQKKENGADGGAASSDPEWPDPGRVDNNNWCTCGRCEARSDVATSFCCRECPQLETIRQEVEGLECCTDHEGIRVNGTNIYFLRAAYNSNRRKYGYRRDKRDDQKWRHVAYGNLVAFAWGWLGIRDRVPLPSCVMKMVAEAFPSTDGQYTGYKDAE